MSDQTLSFAVAAPLDVWYSAFSLQVGTGADATEVRLVDDGSGPDDDAWDGVWHGEVAAPAADTVSVTLKGTQLDGTVTLYDGSVPSAGPQVALVVRAGGATPTAVLADEAWPDGIPAVPKALHATVLWGSLVGLAVFAYLKTGGR